MNQDGKDDFIVTGNGAPNRVYSYDKTSDTYVNIINGVTNVEVNFGSMHVVMITYTHCTNLIRTCWSINYI